MSVAITVTEKCFCGGIKPKTKDDETCKEEEKTPEMCPGRSEKPLGLA